MKKEKSTGIIGHNEKKQYLLMRIQKKSKRKGQKICLNQ